MELKQHILEPLDNKVIIISDEMIAIPFHSRLPA